MAYTADINIVVKGQAAVNKLQRDLDLLGQKLDEITKRRVGPSTALQTFNNQLQEATRRLNEVAAGTSAETEAIKNYVTALGNANAASKRQNDLIEDEIRLREAATNQTEKLAQRQQEFTARTNEAAQAAHRQTAEFYRQQRLAKQVAQLNANAPAAQLLLAPAAPGAPAMGGGARRRITGPVERLGGARTADEAAATLRLAQATDALAQSTNKIDPQYNRFLPSTELLNATNRGIQQLNTNQDAFNQSVASGTRFQEKYNRELERRTRLGIGVPSNVMPGATGRTNGLFPIEGPIPASQVGFGRQRANLATGLRGRLPGAVGGGIIGAAFPLLFGQGAGAATGGGIGGLLGGLTGVPGGSFAGSLLGTLLGDIAEGGAKVKALAEDMGLAKGETEQLAAAFRAAGADAEKFGDAVQYIRGIGFTDPEQVEAIKLVSKLTEDYGGKIDKVTSAYANFAARGKVGISDINKFTAQNIPVLDELEKKFAVNRDAVLKLAKDGKISAQQLSDALIAVANKSKEAADKTNNPWQSAWQKIVSGSQITVNAVGIIFGRLLSPIASVASSIATAFGNAFDFIVRDAVQTAAEIAGALASAANNMQYLTKLKFFGDIKGGAKATQKDLLDLLKAPPKATPVGPIQIPGQLPAAGGGTDKTAKDAQREAARVLEALRDQQLITIEIQRQSEYSKKIFDAEVAKNPVLVRQLEGAQQLAELGVETAKRLEDEKNTSVQLAIAKAQQAKQALIRQKTEQDIAKIEQQRKENAQNTILGLQQELDIKNATTEAERNRLRIMYEMDALRQGGQYTENDLARIEALKKQIAAPETAGEIVQKRIGALQDEITKLTNLGTIAVSVADSIGAAFSQAFEGIVSGTMTTQEALASFFQSVGDAFIQMASQIIAQQITMLILQTLLKALGAPSANAMPFAGGPATGGTTNTFAYGAGAPTFFSPRAGGGPVNAATPYMVGERGPELFVPGTNGGVMSNSDLRASMGSGMGGSAGAPVLNMSFETTSIGGVEYVSRDQLEAAMAATRRQAARDGAQRGMTMTLDKLQQSPRTRSRVGLG